MISLFVIPRKYPTPNDQLKQMNRIVKRHNGQNDGSEVDAKIGIYSWWINFKTKKSAQKAASELQDAGFRTRYRIPHAQSLQNMK